MPAEVRLAAELHLPPVQQFNDIVGNLFKNCRLPEIEHRDAGLQKALTWVLDVAYQSAKKRLEKYEVPRIDGHVPVERWAEQRNVQANRAYLRARFNHFRALAKVRVLYENNKVVTGGWDA